ncbi:MAG TPA: hypothetical protein VFA60_06980 [Terriglobales bacterium]|nr:hypothetical protein [Terriglobales bacterium]
MNRPRATVPPLEDADAIQLALTDLARAVLAETVDLKRASVLAYILQTAVSNLKRVELGLHTEEMTTEPPSLIPETDAIDAAYNTWTPRARDNAANTEATDVMLTRHDIT